jgi:hypothetical protein
LKDSPEAAYTRLAEWAADASRRRMCIIQRAVRLPLASGDSRAVKLLELARRPEVKVKLHLLRKRILVGGNVCFSVDVKSDGARPQRIILTYRFTHQVCKRSRQLKPLHLRVGALMPKQCWRFRRQHSTAQKATRKYSVGEYFLEILVNGRGYGRTRFAIVG